MTQGSQALLGVTREARLQRFEQYFTLSTMALVQSVLLWAPKGAQSQQRSAQEELVYSAQMSAALC